MMIQHRNLDGTREAFLAEGRRLLLAQGLPITIGNIKVAEIARSINRSSGAAYNIWQSQEDFHRELAIMVITDVSWADAAFSGNEIFEVLGRNGSVSEVIQAACNHYLREVTTNREFLIFTHFRAVSVTEPAIKEALQVGYDKFHESFRSLYTALFAHFNLEVISPYSMDDFTVAMTAVTEGFVLRRAIDPERVPMHIERKDVVESPRGWSLYACTVDHLVSVMVRPSHLETTPNDH